MASIDVFTCYTLAGAGSLFGLGLISLVRVESPRVRRTLWLYRLAFLCLAGFLWVGTLPVAQRAQGIGPGGRLLQVHAPGAQQMTEEFAVGGVVIHQEGAHAGEAGGQHAAPGGLALLHHPR